MTFSKIAVGFTAISLLASAPAFAQSAGTSLGGTSDGAQGTPGQSSPSTTGTPMKGSNTMMKSGNGTMAKTPEAGANSTATGGPAGGLPDKH